MNLARVRIRRLLVEETKRGVCLLVAPAGTGKTEALLDVRPHLGVAFPVSLAAENVPAAELGRALVLALSPKDQRNYGTLVARSPSVREMADWLVRRLRGFRGTVIVDDFHRTQLDEHDRIGASELLARVIDGTRQNLKWLIASRTMPAFPIGTWLSTGQVGLTIEEDELRFSEAETQELAKALDVEIDHVTAAAIHVDTGGWAIAVRLSLESWARTRSIEPLRIRTREMLHRYINTEIWQRLESDDVRLLLGAASLFTTVRPTVLKHAGFESPGATLDRIKRVPLITRLTASEYSIHDLLRDFARTWLTDNGHLSDVVHRMGQALQDLGLDGEALQLYAQVGDFERVVSHLSRKGLTLLDFGRRTTIELALASLPRSLWMEDPVVVGIRGALDESVGSFSSAEAHYRHALNSGLPLITVNPLRSRLAGLMINRGRPSEAIPILREAIASAANSLEEVALRANLAAALAQINAAEECLEEIEYVASQLNALDTETRARVLQRMAFASFYFRDYHGAEDYAKQAAELCNSLGLDALASRAYSVLYSIYSLTTAEPASASVAAAQWIAAAERGGDIVMHSNGLRVAYMTARDCGDDATAVNAERTLSAIGEAKSFRDGLPARIARSMYEAGIGNLAKAAAALTGISDKELTSAERALRASMLSVVRAAERNRVAARELLGPSFVAITEVDVFSRRYHNLAQAFRAFAFWLLDSASAARRALNLNEDVAGMAARDRALIDTITDFCHRPIETINQETAITITQPLRELGLHGIAQFLTSCCSGLDRDPVVLTKSELTVLQAFQRASTEIAVAEILGKSRYTVHNHLTSIIKKIGCSGRHEALEYARAQGWL